ncbi:11395_t:CDS:2 [Rhizophagus irregularis]|nr:11395_t:CDS:2 [Rhizophagus irregularis]
MNEPRSLETNNINTRIVNEINKRIGAFLAKETGFSSITSSANEVLANVLETYFENIIKTSQAYAELACRSQINLNDVEKSFKEWNIKTGALEGHIEKCLKAKENYHTFASDLKSSIQSESQSKTPSMTLYNPEDINEDDEYRPKYVPSHMPPFPAKHSYKKTPVSHLYPLQHQEEQKIHNRSSIPDSPDTSSTVVSAVSSPHSYDLLSKSTSRKSSTANIRLSKKRPLENDWSEDEE